MVDSIIPNLIALGKWSLTSPYVQQRVRFNQDRLTSAGSSFNPPATTQAATISFWVNAQNAGGSLQSYIANTGTRFALESIAGSDVFRFTGRNPSGTLVCQFSGSTAIVSSTGLIHALVSFDLANANDAALYVNDTNEASISTFTTGQTTDTDNTTDFVFGDGGAEDGTRYIDADIGDLMLWYGLSITDGAGTIPVATRRLFRDASGNPVDPAVAVAALGTPHLLMGGRNYNATNWNNGENLGSLADLVMAGDSGAVVNV